jgi:hypothetical protein
MSRYAYSIAPADCHFARRAYRVTITRDGAPYAYHPLSEPRLYFAGNDGRSVRAEAVQAAKGYVEALERQWQESVSYQLGRLTIRERTWSQRSDFILERDGRAVTVPGAAPGSATYATRGIAEATRVLLAEATARGLETGQ